MSACPLPFNTNSIAITRGAIIQKTDFEHIAKSIDRDSEGILEESIANAKEKARIEGKTPVLETFDYEVQDRFHGLMIGLAKHIMNALIPLIFLS